LLTRTTNEWETQSGIRNRRRSSSFTTRADIHEANHFNFHPIKEVAILFIGIFATMIPALDWLQLNAGRLGAPTPGVFFWSSGALSSVLDNAPTYLSFFSVMIGAAPAGEMQHLLTTQAPTLVAISVGAVFFGANTYIGNGPNFMVKSIAEQAGVKMPSFFGYMAYSVGILIPLFVVISLVGL